MDWTDKARLEWKQQTGRPPPEFGLFGIPNTISEIFEYAYKKGCRIHSNSWGGGEHGDYDGQCRELDTFVGNRKILQYIVAGNDGSDANSDGKIDLTSVTSPGTAKNCITVGASENQRPEFVTESYFKWWPSTDYPVSPIKDDPITDSTTDVVAFRRQVLKSIKESNQYIVAPSTFILSTRSRYIVKITMAGPNSHITKIISLWEVQVWLRH